jgi:hypothetical protein
MSNCRINYRVTEHVPLDIQVHIPEVTKIKVEPARTPTARFTMAILHLRSAEVPARLCERGLIWQAQIFNCEPYELCRDRYSRVQ